MIIEGNKIFEVGKWISEYDEQGTEISSVYSDKLLNYLGAEGKKVVWEDVIYYEDAKRAREYMLSVCDKNSKNDFELEYRMVTRDGPRWVHDYGHCERRADGTLKSCSGIIFDIQSTVEKEITENKFKESIVNLLERNGESLYIVNPINDTYIIVNQNETLANKYPECNSYTESLNQYISADVFEADRETAYKSLSLKTVCKKLETETEYKAQYRDISTGLTQWYEMYSFKLSVNEIIIQFVNKNNEIIEGRFKDNIYKEQFALFAVDLDSETLTVIKNSPWDEAYSIGDVVPYQHVMRRIGGYYTDEVRNFYEKYSDIEYVRKQLQFEDKQTISYHSTFVTGDKWITVTIYIIARHPDGEAAVVAISFNILDTIGVDRLEMQNEIREKANLISALTSDYYVLILFNLLDGSFKVYSVDDNLLNDSKQLLEEERDGFAFIHKFAKTGAVHPEDKYLFENLTSEELRLKLTGSKKFSLRFRQKFGDRYYWTEMDVVKNEPIDEEAKDIAIGFAIRDKEIELEYENHRQLEEALKKAQEANNAKSAFLFNMSHDIRTPMNAILGYTDIALRNFSDSEKVEGCLEKIRVSGGHLQNLLNDILEMSRIESGNLVISESPIDIRVAIAGVENMSRALAIPKNIDFSVDVCAFENPYLYADELHIDEILINLISNAIKYTGLGGKVGYKIRQISGVENGRVIYEFEISDNGIGMSDEFQEHLFETFSREATATVLMTEGAGLGLSIVKRILDLVCGTITVKSQVGVGSVFTVRIPFRVLSEEDILNYNGNSAAQTAVVKDAENCQCRVLIAEDNEMNREITEELLEEAGYITDTAVDGDIAVNMVKERGIDYYGCILMDIQMPVMNGYEATKQIRKLPGGDRIPIIALSANAFEDDKLKSIEMGMNAHIAKPINVKILFETMNSLMNK